MIEDRELGGAATDVNEKHRQVVQVESSRDGELDETGFFRPFDDGELEA